MCKDEGQEPDLQRIMAETQTRLDERNVRQREARDNPSEGRGPFERFKGIVDDGLQTMYKGIGSFNPLRVPPGEWELRHQREVERMDAEEFDISRRWTGSELPPGEVQRAQQEKLSVLSDEQMLVMDSTNMLLRESWRRNRHVPTQKILDLCYEPDRYQSIDDSSPMLSLGGACYYKSEYDDNLPSSARYSLRGLPKWLSVDWFKRDPYSPLRLEAHPQMCCAGSSWRAAFEELLCASLDKPMDSREKIGIRAPFGTPQSTYYGPGLDWFLSLQCRGILPPPLPIFYSRQQYRYNDMKQELDLALAGKWPNVAISEDMAEDFNHLAAEVANTVGPAVLDSTGYPSATATPDTELDFYDRLLDDAATTKADVHGMVRQIEQAAESETGSDYDFEAAWDKLDELVSTFADRMILGENTAETTKQQQLELWRALKEGDVGDASRRLDAHLARDPLLKRMLHQASNRLDTVGGFPGPLELHLVLLAFARSIGVDDEQLSDPSWARDFDAFLERFGIPGADASPEELLVALRCAPTRMPPDYAHEAPSQPPPTNQPQQLAAPPEPSSEAAVSSPQKPDILSQLTTTQTTRLPDGTVTTKVVLKKRFADGREETNESTQTTCETAEMQQARALGLDDEEGRERKREAGRGKGWFWS